MIDVVVQEEETGCGLACVAMLCGKSYETIKQLANSQGIHASDRRLFSETAYVRNLLEQFAISLSEHQIPFVSWDGLPDCALLATKYHVEEGNACWHWCVFVRENGNSYVLDPARHLEGKKRMDLGIIQVKWYLTVNA